MRFEVALPIAAGIVLLWAVNKGYTKNFAAAWNALINAKPASSRSSPNAPSSSIGTGGLNLFRPAPPLAPNQGGFNMFGVSPNSGLF